MHSNTYQSRSRMCLPLKLRYKDSCHQSNCACRRAMPEAKELRILVEVLAFEERDCFRRKWWRQQSQLFLRTCWVAYRSDHFFSNHSATPATAGASKTRQRLPAPAVNRTDWNHCCLPVDSCAFVLLLFLFQHCLRVSKEFPSMRLHAEARSNSIKVFFRTRKLHSGGTRFMQFFSPEALEAGSSKSQGQTPRPRLNPRPRPKHCLGPLVPLSPALDMQKAYKARAAAAPGGSAQHPPGPLTGGRYPLPLFGDAWARVCAGMGPWSAGPLRAVLCDCCVALWLLCASWCDWSRSQSGSSMFIPWKAT